MRLSLDLLRRHVDLPADPAAVRSLLDACGLEVKRIDPAAAGVPVTLELLANRGDHHCLTGIARELSGHTGATVRWPEVTPLTAGDGPHPVHLHTDLCPVYTLTRLVRRGDGALAPEALAVLDGTGLKSVGPVVDATNVAYKELGQPTHAFDAATIEGPITVRLSRPGEQAWPLFQEAKVTVPEGTIVIADDVKVLAIAGVIGCEESKTTAATTTVLLESAAFDPVAVRKAARALGLATDSSARFERGADFSQPLQGAGRVATLLAAAGWEVDGPTGVAGGWTDPRRVVRMVPERCRRFLDVTTSDDELVARLARYGFVCTPEADGALAVRVPPHRLWDVVYPADLYEEVVKSIGYEHTPRGLPPVDMGALPTPVESVSDTVADVLVGAGFYEVVTDGFYSRALRDQLGFGPGHPLHAHVETANALDRAYSLLKNNALAQAVEGVALNVRMKHDAIKAFEFTRTFHPDPTASNGVCSERRLVWALCAGPERPATWAGPARPADVWFLKGLVDEIAHALDLPLQVGPADAAQPLSSALHPGRQATVCLDGRVVGILGEVHPEVVARFKLKRIRPCYLELGLVDLCADARPPAFSEPPRVPPVVRNLAFTLPPKVAAGDVADALQAAGPAWLRSVEVVDLFEHVEDGVPMRTFTYALTYANDDGDRTAEAMNGATEALIAVVDAAFGPAGVKLR
ncbi:MAG: phenylalanine--tRNA ligase subunit beta [Alphaproteobacteria bacterium]|nr:phenylalanine--tRNA ligase subunit beta [Alphaproteobacteria bacterium]